MLLEMMLALSTSVDPMPFERTAMSVRPVRQIQASKCDQPNWGLMHALFTGDISPPSADVSVCGNPAYLPINCRYELRASCVWGCGDAFDVAIDIFRLEATQAITDAVFKYDSCLDAATDDYIECVLVDCDDGSTECIERCGRQHQYQVCQCSSIGTDLLADLMAGLQAIIDDYNDCIKSCCMTVCDDE